MGTDNSERALSQNDKVLNYMKKHGSITSREAMLNLGCYRLASRINDLKEKRGCKIITTLIHTKDEDGKAMRYASYSLAKES